MCVRTKQSYGCGCIYKSTIDCCSSQCSGLERYHYPKEGDCRSCRGGGGTITRGREGKGRYGQEINKRSPIDVSGGASPRAPTPSARLKQDWQSSTKQKVDSAWEEEHSSHIGDAVQRVQKMRIASESRRGCSNSPAEEYDHSDRYHSSDSEHRSRLTSKKLFAEVDRGYRPSTYRKRDHRRSGSVLSRASSRNSSLGGGRHFERDYQRPEFTRGRTGSGSDVSLYFATISLFPY